LLVEAARLVGDVVSTMPAIFEGSTRTTGRADAVAHRVERDLAAVRRIARLEDVVETAQRGGLVRG
jgi:hypothetical protein